MLTKSARSAVKPHANLEEETHSRWRLSSDGTKCSVIIPHHNYASLVGAALRSVLSQSHENFECIVVDDGSEPAQIDSLKSTIKDLCDSRLRLICLDQNKGQTGAIFAGLEMAESDFVSLLDPDDVYEPAFLESLLRAHLNPVVVAAMAACEMGLFRVGGGALSREASGFRRRMEAAKLLRECEYSLGSFGFSKYFPPWVVGWHWASTSSMMFRRDALELIRPSEFPKDIKFNADSYCAFGAHFLGGTLFVDQVLSWRGIHGRNTARVDCTFSSDQIRLKDSFVDYNEVVKKAALNSFFSNGKARLLTVAALGEVLMGHFQKSELAEWALESEEVREVLVRSAANLPWDGE